MSTSGSKSKRGAKRVAEEDEEVEEMVEKLEADGTLRNESSEEDEEEEDDAMRHLKKTRNEALAAAKRHMEGTDDEEKEASRVKKLRHDLLAAVKEHTEDGDDGDEHEEPVETDLSLAETFEDQLHKNWELQEPDPVHVAALTEKALNATIKMVNDHLKAFLTRVRDAVHRLAGEGEFCFEANLPLQSLPRCLRAFNQRSYMIGAIRDAFPGFTVTDHPTAATHITLDWEPIEK